MFDNREAAAKRLAEAVLEAAPEDPVILALPRGGVPLGRIVADRLGAPLDLVFVRKIGLPRHRELAAGALVDGASPQTVWNDQVLQGAGLTEQDFEEEIDGLLRQIAERRARYMAGREPVPVAGRTAILVDDGIATGATIRVAIAAMRKAGARAVWIAVPVAPSEMIPAPQVGGRPGHLPRDAAALLRRRGSITSISARSRTTTWCAFFPLRAGCHLRPPR
jgi:putative phosphoribosyl transferase